MKSQMQNIMTKILERGADKVSLRYTASNNEEFSIIYKRLSFLRSVESGSLNIGIISDQRSANTRLNQFDDASIDTAIDTLFANLESASPDPAYDISPSQEPRSWDRRKHEPEIDIVVSRLNEFIESMQREFPQVEYDARLTHLLYRDIYMNSNGVLLDDTTAGYSFVVIVTAKEGSKCSSMNYTSFLVQDLNLPILETLDTREKIQQVCEQIFTKPVPENFVGSVIFSWGETAWVVEEMIDTQLGDSPFLTKICRFTEHLGKKIADPKLSVYSRPDESMFCFVPHITADGFISKDASIIEKGILMDFPISLFTSRKCERERTMGPISNLYIEPGDTPLADMISSTKRGIYLVRCSGDSPNDNGDFSGVAKNSYYIEDGKIQYPISETMISGNLLDMLNNIEAISKEQLNSGTMASPYIKVSGVNISRK